MKQKKQFNVFGKIRTALRGIYRYSPMRREAVKAATQKDPEQGSFFVCPLCKKQWPVQMIDVDHQPQCGSLQKWEDLTQFAVQLFEGPVRVICKICHKKVTKTQRTKKAK